jgi:hypothetical protein
MGFLVLLHLGKNQVVSSRTLLTAVSVFQGHKSLRVSSTLPLILPP